MKNFQFGNVVVVYGDQIGVIVKSWADGSHEVYVRSLNAVVLFSATKIKHYVYSKELTDDERGFYGA